MLLHIMKIRNSESTSFFWFMPFHFSACIYIFSLSILHQSQAPKNSQEWWYLSMTSSTYCSFPPISWHSGYSLPFFFLTIAPRPSAMRAHRDKFMYHWISKPEESLGIKYLSPSLRAEVGFCQNVFVTITLEVRLALGIMIEPITPSLIPLHPKRCGHLPGAKLIYAFISFCRKGL